MISRIEFHAHTHRSNLFCRDSTNFETDLIDKALELGLGGIAITDHGNLSAHVVCIKYMKKLKDQARKQLKENPNDPVLIEKVERLNKFKLGLGTEIYLVHRENVQFARENNEYTRFNHLVVVAKNKRGYQGLRKLSSNSWENSFYHRGMERIPTYWDWFIDWAKEYHKDVIVTTACLGSEFAQLCLGFIEEQSETNRKNIKDFVLKMKGIFGENFYIEIQPSHFEEQIAYNKLAIQIAESFNVPVVIDTDAHYLTADMKEIHSIFLKSQNAERETEQFYASCYLMNNDELKEYFTYLPDELFNKFIENSAMAGQDIEEYDLFKKTEVPHSTVDFDYTRMSVLAPIVMADMQSVEKYCNIVRYGTSEHLADRILLQKIEEGIIEKNIKIDTILLERINDELESLWEISKSLDQRLSDYYLLTKELVEIMWTVSLVGVSRGSAGAFMICYLLGITQINPIDNNLPHWRHISKERPELPDIDIDSEKGQRQNILEAVKLKYGYKKVLNISTFKTEGTASAIQTMCRGMGIPTEDASYISSLVVEGKSIKECLDSFKTDKECSTLIKEMMRYEGLIESVVAIEGLVCGRSVHASGVYILNEDYDECLAMMKAPSGQPITQYDMSDSDYQGGLKVDFLTIEALDRIRKDMELLIDDGVIEWKGSLKKTYDSYIHPDVLDLEDPEMWRMLRDGEILDAFQYDSVQGRNAIATIGMDSFQQALDGNALMRLSCEGEQPMQRYKRFKDDINFWYEEMKDYGLASEEIMVMREHLDKSFGVAPTQESVMRLSMDMRIAGFDLVWANKLRKAIAKAKAKDMVDEVYNKFMNSGTGLGNREVFLQYVWDSCIVPQLGYAFSEPHLAGYTMILAQEMNLARLSPLHWKVACLCVNSGDINEEISASTDYGAIAKAIAGMEKGFVVPPSINNSYLGFKPDMSKGKALYGLSAINGISNELAKQLIELRPFSSFDDFIQKAVETKIVKPSKVYNLIKSGCFDEFGKDRIQTMVDYVNYLVPEKEKLTTANIPKLNEYGLIPQEYFKNYVLYLFKKAVFTKENCSYMINKTQGVYRVGTLADLYGVDIDKYIEATEYDDNGALCLKSKEFDKLYKTTQKEFEAWVKSEDAINRFNYCTRNEVWLKYCQGSLAKWEMDSICYYTKTHELEEIDVDKFYTTTSFFELPKEPEFYYEKNQRTNREYKRFYLYGIAGVVVEKNKNKSMITLSTKEGVVDVKLNRDTFAHYDRKLENEASWFSRGTKLFIAGYRRGETFVPRTYKDSIFESPIMKISVNPNGIKIESKRSVEEEYCIF